MHLQLYFYSPYQARERERERERQREGAVTTATPSPLSCSLSLALSLAVSPSAGVAALLCCSLYSIDFPGELAEVETLHSIFLPRSGEPEEFSVLPSAHLTLYLD